MQSDAIDGEKQQSGIAAFLLACSIAGWLEYRNLRYYPSNLGLAAVQGLTTVALWYFTARFLSAGADRTVERYGGHYLAYVLIGVLFNSIGLAALNSPFSTISEAFWDKRLETYRLSVHGIWANVIGRLGWQVLFSTALQGGALAGLLVIGALDLKVGWEVGLAVLTYVLLVVANAGIGIAGASLFFLLDVKSGADPITWLYKYLIMLMTGLYVPLTVLPQWVQTIGSILPQSYVFSLERSILLRGSVPNANVVITSFTGLFIVTAIVAVWGYFMLRTALQRAERHGGIGVVV